MTSQATANTTNSPRSIITAISTAVLAIALLAACSSGGSGSDMTPSNSQTTATVAPRIASTAVVTIVTPTYGQRFTGTTIPVKIKLKNAHLSPMESMTMDLKPDEGHIHIYVDDQAKSMTSSLEQDITDIPPGRHILKVEFVANDHNPFYPRVITQVAFENAP